MYNSIEIGCTIYCEINIGKVTVIILLKSYIILEYSYIIHTFINFTQFALIKKIRALFPFWYISKITLFPTSSTLVEKQIHRHFNLITLFTPKQGNKVRMSWFFIISTKVKKLKKQGSFCFFFK